MRVLIGTVVVGLLVGMGGLAQSRAEKIPKPQGERAVFAIEDDVVVAQPPLFGVNVEPPAMSHWDTEPWHNEWWSGSAINPFSAQHRGEVSKGGADFFEHNEGWKIGFWDVFRDGFFDGGTARIYRFEDGKMTKVREGKIARFQASVNGPNRVTLAEPGPEIKQGDFYFLEVERSDVPPGTTRTYEGKPTWLVSSYHLEEDRERELIEAGVKVALVPDPAPIGSRAALKLTIPEGQKEPVRIGSWLIAGMQPDWPRLREGRPYEVCLWLKQEGMEIGDVEVRIASLKTEKIEVGTDWQEYTISFTGGPPGSGAERFDLGTAEAGNLLIGGVSIRELGETPPGAFYPEVVEALKWFRPAHLRLWTLQENRGFGVRLDDALGPPRESTMVFRELRGARPGSVVGLHRELELCAEVGADPWIIVSVMFSEEELTNLIEYLAGPADTPYGKKRAGWGREKPWTEQFKRIIIEPGNEVWNGMFAPQQMAGRPKQYGALSEHMFQTIKQSPYYQDGKYVFLVNGWIAQPGRGGFGYQALEHAPSAEGYDIAYYTGGWDAVGVMKADSPTESWMNALNYSRRMLLPRSKEAIEAARMLGRERGRPASVWVYEAGPGYTLPGPGKFNRAEQEEGKSLGHAINNLDSFMGNLRAGLGEQSFFMFKNGHYWASHSRTWVPHAAWLALGLRNRELRGDLITARAEEMVTIDLPETEAETVDQSNSADRNLRTFPAVPNLPLVDCYPFKDGDRYSFMLVSRRLDGPTPVTLKLPFDPEEGYTVHSLTADSPGAHNIDEEVVRVVSEEKTGMTREFTFDLPPHSVVVLVARVKGE